MNTFTRQPHYLRANKTTSVPTNLAFVAAVPKARLVDTSKNVTVHTLGMVRAEFTRLVTRNGVAHHTHLGARVDDFWTDLYTSCNLKKPLWVFGHDWPLLSGLLNLWGEVAGGRISHNMDDCVPPGSYQAMSNMIKRDRMFAVLENPPFILIAWHYGCKIILVDIRNYCDHSIDTLASSVGVDMYAAYDPGYAWDHIEEHLERVVKTVRESALRTIAYVKDNDLGKFAYTASGQAMQAFRHRFMDHDILIHGDKDTLDLERESYRGGRSDIFYYGKAKERIYKVDCNGLFPYVMADHIYPIKPLSAHDYISPDAALRYVAAKPCIARVIIDSSGNEYHAPLDCRTVYARGKYQTTLAGPELLRALSCGEVVHVGKLVVYEGERIFERYVRWFSIQRTLARSRGDTLGEQAAKRYLVSLYGKFGQRGLRWEEAKGVVCMEDNLTWWQEIAEHGEGALYRCLNGVVEVQKMDSESADSFPAIASFVTSHARCYMDNARCVVGVNNCYMQYVDALYVNDKGLDNMAREGLIHPTELGKFKYQGDISSLTLHSPQHYVIDGQEIICGIPMTSRKLDERVYVVPCREGPKEISARNPDGTVKTVQVRYKIEDSPPIAAVAPDGWIHPLVLPLD